MTLKNESVKQESLFLNLMKNPMAVVSMSILIIVIISGIFAGKIAPYDPNDADIWNILASPGNGHLMGTDSAGRDVFSRLLYGTQNSLAAAAVAVIISMVIGVITGLFAGYYGGLLETVASWVSSLVMALPAIVILLAASSVLGPSIWTAMVIFGFLMSPGFYRLVYTTVNGVRNELYVDAARVTGLSDARIITRHILSVVRAPIIIQIGIISSIAIAIQTGLQFLGIGDIKVATWGSLLVDGFLRLFSKPLLLLWPSLIIGLTTMAFALLANSIRDALDRSSVVMDKETRQPRSSDIKHVEMICHPDNEKKKDPILVINDLEVGFPQGKGKYNSVVKGISLTVHKGEVVGLIGESGSGKTMTAFSVLGLLPPGGRILGGSIKFDSLELTGIAGIKSQNRLRGHRISYVPQEPMSNLDPSFTVGSQLVEPMRVSLGIGRKEAKEKALHLLETVGIPNPDVTYKAYPHEISGGMAQRVLIAGAVSCEPDLVIADEPTTALDVTVQAEVLDLLRRMQEATHTAMLLVTHNFGVIADLSDSVSVMKDGRIIESGAVRSVFNDARHEYTRSLLDSVLENAPPRKPYKPPVKENA